MAKDLDQNIDRNAWGQIVAHELTAFQCSEAGLRVVMRLEWLEPRTGKRPRARSVQLHLDPDTAKQIGQNLLRVAPSHGISGAGSA